VNTNNSPFGLSLFDRLRTGRSKPCAQVPFDKLRENGWVSQEPFDKPVVSLSKRPSENGWVSQEPFDKPVLSLSKRPSESGWGSQEPFDKPALSLSKRLRENGWVSCP
jgi:hypothetical protein